MALMATEKPANVELRPDEIRPDAQWDVIQGDDFLGVVTDEGEWGQARGRFAAWSSKCRSPRGAVGFFDSKGEAADAIARLFQVAPERRTLKGVAVPFQVIATVTASGHISPSRNPKAPEGEPFTVVRTEVRYDCRYGYTEDGREINFIGTAAKFWVIVGPALP